MPVVLPPSVAHTWPDPKWSSSVEDFRKGGALNNSSDVAARVNAVTFDTPSTLELRSGWKGAAMSDCLVCSRPLSNGACCCCRPCWRELLYVHGRRTAAEIAARLLWDYWPIWQHDRERAAA